MLRAELAFYIGCLNLRHELERRGVPLCRPVPHPGNERIHAMEGLYDASLALRLDTAPVGNDVSAGGKALVVVTGANEGGKSTFLRGMGLAQLMMQAGMFVTAASFAANVCDGIFTHYKREEDATMQGGKLDEELKRMSEIVDHMQENALFLSNEREGAEIARQIVHRARRREPNRRGWLPFVCDRCIGRDGPVLCRSHMIEALGQTHWGDVRSQRVHVEAIRAHLANFENAFRWDRRDTDTGRGPRCLDRCDRLVRWVERAADTSARRVDLKGSLMQRRLPAGTCPRAYAVHIGQTMVKVDACLCKALHCLNPSVLDSPFSCTLADAAPVHRKLRLGPIRAARARRYRHRRKRSS